MTVHATGLRVRTERGTVVLDGAQSCTAYLSLGAQFETEEVTHDFADGTMLSVVEMTMDDEASTLLSNSRVDYGWYVRDDTERTRGESDE